MDEIKNILNQVIGQLSSHKPIKGNPLERLWVNVLEEDELQHVKLVGEKSGYLSVNVDSPAWLYHMNTRKFKILNRLKEDYPDAKQISFRIGKVK